MADAADLKSVAERREGSNPSPGTNLFPRHHGLEWGCDAHRDFKPLDSAALNTSTLLVLTIAVLNTDTNMSVVARDMVRWISMQNTIME